MSIERTVEDLVVATTHQESKRFLNAADAEIDDIVSRVLSSMAGMPIMGHQDSPQQQMVSPQDQALAMAFHGAVLNPDRPLPPKPEAAKPMMQPGMMQPGMMQPGMMQPGMVQPGMMQPGMQQPGGMMQPTMPPPQTAPGGMPPPPQKGMPPQQPGTGAPPPMKGMMQTADAALAARQLAVQQLQRLLPQQRNRHFVFLDVEEFLRNPQICTVIAELLAMEEQELCAMYGVADPSLLPPLARGSSDPPEVLLLRSPPEAQSMLRIQTYFTAAVDPFLHDINNYGLMYKRPNCARLGQWQKWRDERRARFLEASPAEQIEIVFQLCRRLKGHVASGHPRRDAAGKQEEGVR